jgi:excisionase family DNA binding protein
MRNATTPRRIPAASPTAKFPVRSADSQDEVRSEPPAMYNILLALEAVHRMLTVREVAELLQKSHFSIYRMAQRRQIPSLMIGGTRYFDPSVLALWLSKKEPSLAAAARRLKTA